MQLHVRMYMAGVTRHPWLMQEFRRVRSLVQSVSRLCSRNSNHCLKNFHQSTMPLSHEESSCVKEHLLPFFEVKAWEGMYIARTQK